MLNPDFLLSVMLVFVRVSGLLLTAPFFNQKTFPVRLKVLFAALLAYVLVWAVPTDPPDTAFHPVGLAAAVIIEAFTGLMLGFAAQLIFWSVQYAAEVLGFQMGLSMAQVLNPTSGQPSNPLGSIIMMTLLLVFVVLDGHHQVLKALVLSYRVVPLAGANLGAGGPLMLGWMGEFFLNALRIASPFMITFFLVESTLGVFAKAVPQADLFSLSLPLKLLLGLGISVFFMQNLFPIIPAFIDQMYGYLLDMLEVFAT